MSLTIKSSVFVAALMAATTLSAHFAWVETSSATLKAGQATTVKIGFGHEVGNSESAVSLDGLTLWAVAPNGEKSALTPRVDGKWVVADFKAKSAGVYRFVLAQDRGVMSQTTKGYKPGGRDVHPDAKKSMKMWRSAVAYAWTDGASHSAGKPLGLPIEVLADRKGDSVELTVLRDGKTVSGAEIGMNVPGKEEADPVGKSGTDGKFTHKLPAKGPALFLVTTADPAPKGANYDTYNLTTVVVVN